MAEWETVPQDSSMLQTKFSFTLAAPCWNWAKVYILNPSHSELPLDLSDAKEKLGNLVRLCNHEIVAGIDVPDASA